MKPAYAPPFTITPGILSLVAQIGEEMGRHGARPAAAMTPALRRGNRLRSIHASLAIEHNSLSLEQVTAVIAGRRVLGPPREIQEVRNAFAAYEAMDSWTPSSSRDLLAAHRILMTGLIDHAGRYRTGGVGIAQGTRIIHLAPPADRVPALIKDLLGWLKSTDTHPLITSCVVHYELEFIHPFADGNGRMGRLWQTLILSRWKPLLAFLPVESVIRDRQAEYYRVLAAADKAGESTPFIEFLLSALLQALREIPVTEQVTDPVTGEVTGEVARFILVLNEQNLSREEAQSLLGLKSQANFRDRYLMPALAAGLIERTLPGKPNSRLQKYRLTAQGRAWFSRHPH